jgi:hypothetical protein
LNNASCEAGYDLNPIEVFRTQHVYQYDVGTMAFLLQEE